MAVDRVGGLARSGWVPAAIVTAAIVALQLLSGTSARDLLAFGAYALLCLVVPGTLLWRLLRPVKARLWVEDVVFGAILGYAVEIPVYVLARFVDAPLLVLAWPLAVYAFALATARGRTLWRRPDLGRLPTWWSWSVAAVTTYLVLFVARGNWWPSGLGTDQLRVIGPDASFQLALTGELRHHMPPAIPWVSGEPLHYHWLTYAHTASATWISAVEPVVMLRRLAPLLMAVLVVLAVALIAYRLSARLSSGPLAAALLVLVHSPAFYATETDHFQRQEFTSSAIFGSPTMTFGTLLFCGVLLLVVEMLRGRSSPVVWLLLTLFVAATSGAKATFPPMIVAGVVAVVLVGWLTRSVTKTHLQLLALAVTLWMVFQLGFYGGEDTGARLSPMGTFEFAAAAFGATNPEPWTLSALALGAVIVLLWVVHMAGMIGLLPNRGWREPETVFLWAFTLSGVGAALLLDLGAASQQWFVTSTHVTAAVGAAVGFGRLLPEGRSRRALPFVLLSALVALFGMAFGWLSTPTRVPPPGPTAERLWAYAAPFLITVVAVLVLAAATHLRRHALELPAIGLVVLTVGLTSLGLFRTVQVTVALGQLPWETPALPAAEDTTVGRDGVAVMRWLRSQTDRDDLLATNGHTLTPASDLQLAFWLAGYTERRVLVESWGYTPHHARIMADTGLGFDDVPFWDEERLRLNDQAFTDPTVSRLEELRRDHGVSWLVLDKRFPSDPEAVSRLLEPAYSRGDYVVYDLGGAFS